MHTYGKHKRTYTIIYRHRSYRLHRTRPLLRQHPHTIRPELFNGRFVDQANRNRVGKIDRWSPSFESEIVHIRNKRHAVQNRENNAKK